MSDPPTFYTSATTFEKYLSRTSYYRHLQAAVTTLATAIDPAAIADLGATTGETTRRLADALPETPVTAVESRDALLETLRETTTDRSTVSVHTAAQTEYVTESDPLPELVVSLYSFRFVPDPLRQKVDFLEAVYRGLPEGGYLCVADRFLDQMQRSDDADDRLRQRQRRRGTEAYASTFWASLDDIDDAAIERAQTVAEFSKQHEAEVGDAMLDRDGQYPVSRDWVTYQARDAVGFEVVLSEPVTALGDGVVVLRK